MEYTGPLPTRTGGLQILMLVILIAIFAAAGYMYYKSTEKLVVFYNKLKENDGRTDLVPLPYRCPYN